MTTELRRLDADADESCVRQALAWVDTYPRWFREADSSAWGATDPDEHLESLRTKERADFGLFVDGELQALVIAEFVGNGFVNSHILTKRGADPLDVAAAARCVMVNLFALGMREAWAWVARQNRGVRRIVESIGMTRDGIARIKGTAHGRPVEWQRFSARRA
jgi:hypothetical protein